MVRLFLLRLLPCRAFGDKLPRRDFSPSAAPAEAKDSHAAYLLHPAPSSATAA